MKQSFVSLLLLLSASFILPSCEKEVFDYSPQMEAYYVESKGLSAVTIDSVTLFKNHSGCICGAVAKMGEADTGKVYEVHRCA